MKPRPLRVTRSLGPLPPLARAPRRLPRRWGAAVRMPVNDHRATFCHRIDPGDLEWLIEEVYDRLD